MARMNAAEATRFYGFPVTKQMTAVTTERLTLPAQDDLIAAHLKINYGYFGAIDKTLAGFYILDDEGDDYTLLDVRGAGQVFRQEHEEGTFSLAYDSLDAYVAMTRAMATKDENAEEDEIRGRFFAKKLRKTPGLSTVQLAQRYRWLVWMLAQPLEREGTAVQDADEMSSTGLSWYLQEWPTREKVARAFKAEQKLLAGDPHLAIYWLLHTTLFADDRGRAQVVASLGKKATPLVRAFVDVFGTLGLQSDVRVVPGFRERRAYAIMFSGADEPDQAQKALVAVEVAPTASYLATTHWVLDAFENGSLAVNDVDAVLRRIPERTLATETLRTVVSQRLGRSAAAHANCVVQLAAKSNLPWQRLDVFVTTVASLASDLVALEPVARRLLAEDEYQRRFLKMAIDVQTRAGKVLFAPLAKLQAQLGIAEAIFPVYSELADKPEHAKKILARVRDPKLVRALSRRILQRADVDELKAPAFSWALRAVLQSRDADAHDLLSRGLDKIPLSEKFPLFKEMKAAVTSADHPLVDVILKTLAGAKEADESKLGSSFAIGEMAEELLRILRRFAHQPKIFDALMAMVEKPVSEDIVSNIWDELFYPLERHRCILKSLTGAQATRAARVMLGSALGRPGVEGNSSAGHQLYRFNHPGAERFLIEALDEYGAKYQADLPLRKSDEELSDRYEDTVANLYSAVGNMKSDGARQALVERIFQERRAYWRMANAFSEMKPSAHAQAMKALSARKDPYAAAAYAYTVGEHVKKGDQQVELLEEIVTWPLPKESLARGFFKYALVCGIAEALPAKELVLAKTAAALLATIDGEPIYPETYARDRKWTNPLANKELKKQLDLAMKSDDQAPARSANAKPAGKRLQAGGTVHGLSLSPDGKRLAMIGIGVGGAFDTATGAQVPFKDARGHAYDIVYHPTEDAAVGCYHAGHILLFDTKTGKTRRRFEGQCGVPDGVRKVAFSADGLRLASVSDNRTLWLWDVKSGKALKKYRDPRDVNTVSFIPGRSDRMAIGTDDHIRIIDFATGKNVSTAGLKDGTAEVQVLDDGTLVTEWGGSIRFLDGKLREKRTLAQGDVSRLRVSRDGKRLYAASWGGKMAGVWRWDLATGKATRLKTRVTGPFWALALDPVTERLYAGSNDPYIVVWDGPTGEVVRE